MDVRYFVDVKGQQIVMPMPCLQEGPRIFLHEKRMHDSFGTNVD